MKKLFLLLIIPVIGFLGMKDAKALEVTWDNIADRFIELSKVDGVTMTKKPDGIDISVNNPTYGAYNMSFKYADNKITYTNIRTGGTDNQKVYYSYMDDLFFNILMLTTFDTYKIPSKYLLSAGLNPENGINRVSNEYVYGSLSTGGVSGMYVTNSIVIDLQKYSETFASIIGTMPDDEYNDFEVKSNAWHGMIKLNLLQNNPMRDNIDGLSIDSKESDELTQKITAIILENQGNADLDNFSKPDNYDKSVVNPSLETKEEPSALETIQTKENPKTGTELPIACGIGVLIVAFSSLLALRKQNLFRNI